MLWLLPAACGISSQAMTGGNSSNAEDMVRYQNAVDWAKRVIVSAKNATN